MLELSFGYPQIAAILILVQRGLEEIYSARNTKRLIAEGAQEVGRDYYPVVAITHLAWIAAIFMLIPVTAQPSLCSKPRPHSWGSTRHRRTSCCSPLLTS